MNRFYIFYSFCLILLSSSCAPRRNLVYFSDLSNKTGNDQLIIADTEPKIQTNDLLSVTINTLSSESNILFSSNTNNINKSGYFEKDGYRVDKEGNINLPVAGLIPLKGLTLEQAQQRMVKTLSNYVKNPIVNIQFQNFRITVIGEVNNPATFNIPNEQINLLEALGMAGDLTVYGKRENVLVIREIDGKRTIVRMNLNNRDVLNSPYFYLKQNDVIYVEPDKSKSIEYSPNNRLMPLVVATISAIAVLSTALLSN
ncbi:polysaccharide biosynthesis/export family protein [Pedobacter cryophilus]|uniref:Sugar transporter n=1 Tax=Pedobacter cryophilus TaxID=2571271 RepID=A0A4V5NXE0_9SPHI|nr:polysaccharide biosynthesis/export family protein [Pedobacter cryophilus]TKB97637.1 sugar transporter [Pedobacter cryophilus]